MKLTISRWFAQRDPIEQQLEELRRQGSGMARAAHLCATLLVVLFSAGSFVALGSDALRSVLDQWQVSHTLDIPSAISLAVSTLMVAAMDVAMLSAAASLRLLASRRAEISEMLLHVAVMAGVCILESGTYLYMSWQFEHPGTAAAGALIVARALAAPLLAVYLASRRVLPITSRDILAASEIAAGAGVLRDVTTAARDQNAPLDRKMRLYGAAAVMTPTDRARLDGMIGAVVQESREVQGSIIQGGLARGIESAYNHAYIRPGEREMLTPPLGHLVKLDAPESAVNASGTEPDSDPTPPSTGPGSPSAAPAHERGVRTPSEPIPLRPPRTSRPRKVAARGHAKQDAEARVRSVWQPGMTITQLERAADVSRSTAHKWNRVIVGERQQVENVAEHAL